MRVGAVGNLSDTQLLERFLDRRDGGEAAFEVLVARHGAMVMGVCRQVLGPADGVEDAFQATFLVLVRQAGSIRKRESLGPWLHGVARRVAMRSRRDAARRRDRERAAFRVVHGDEPDSSLAATLHDEIARLPEKYRTPIVLCDLEGQSHAEAARRLDWPIGTVSGRLSRARALLRSRIARRGLALSTAAIASTLGTARASVAPQLVTRTVELAASSVTGLSVSHSAAALAATVLQVRALPFLKIAAGLILSAGLGVSGLQALREQAAAEPSRSVSAASPQTSPATPPTTRREPAAARRRQIEDERHITSVALAPDGVTLASGSLDATVTLWDLETGQEKSTFLGHTGAVTSLAFTHDGRMLASASDDHTVKLWNVATGRAALTVTWLEPAEAPPIDLGSGSPDSGRGAPGRDRCADGPVREADCSGA
ncbi:MAG: polymerase sigma factor, sigma-70 family [Planctomycetota bacterium]|nr:polymerase sigma factor, sigma-70 family [Planctomycetota bacterium]